MTLRVTLMGSGTSTGVPVIGCDCAVCTSTDARDRRMRPGVLLELPGGCAVVDTSCDFREQALRFRISRLDAILYTHAHADHILGLDDIRIFNFRQRAAIPCYGSADTLARLRRTFAYAFENGQEGGGKPKVDLVPVAAPFGLLGATIEPVPLLHGELSVFAYRIGRFALATDVNAIPESSFDRLRDLDVLVLSALRFRPHPTHFTIDEALEAARRVGARRTVLTHVAHDVAHAALAAKLPAGVELGYDGLAFEVD